MTWGGYAILTYVALQVAIGFAVARRVNTEEDYLLGGRSLGLGMASATIFATWFGAETCVGAAGAVYEHGLSGGSSDPFGYTIAILLAGLLLAAPLWRRKLTTLGDLLRERYGPSVEALGVVVMVPGSILWAGAQVRAFGHVLAASGGVEPELGIAVAAIVVVAYTAVGGMLADAYSDLIQGAVLIAGLLFLGGSLLVSGELASIQLAQLDPIDPEGTVIGTAEAWAIPILGSLVAQELCARMLASRSEGIARNAALIAAPVYLLVGLIPVAVGLAAVWSLPGLEDPEQALALQAQRHLGPVLYVVFAGALVSAILSTVDSALLAAGSLTAHNLVLRWVQLDERGKLWVNKGTVVAFGVVAWVLALNADSVHELVVEASSFGSPGLVVVVLVALYSPFGGALAATAALITGVGAYAIGQFGLEIEAPFLTALASAGLAYLGVGAAETRLPRAAPARA